MSIIIRYLTGEEIGLADWIGLTFWVLVAGGLALYAGRYARQARMSAILLNQLKEQDRHQDSLARITAESVRPQSLDSFINFALSDLAQTLEGVMAVLMEIKKEEGMEYEVEICGSVGIKTFPLGCRFSPEGEGPIRLALLTNRPLICPDIRREHNFILPETLQRMNILSLLLVAVPRLDGTRWGIVGIACNRPRNFSPDDLGYINSLAQLVGSVIDRMQTEMLYRLLADSEEEIVFRKDPQGQVTYISPSVDRVLGYSQTELMALPKGFIRSVCHPEDLELVEDLCTQPGQRYEADVRLHRRKDDKYRWFTIMAEPVSNGAFDGWRGTCRDIDERMMIERELSESQSKYASIVEAAMDAILMIDNQDRIQLFNPAAEQMFRIPAPDVLGTSVTRFIPSNKRGAYIEHTGEYADGEAGQHQRTARTMLLREDGSDFPCELTLSQGILGEERFMTMIVRDITDQARVEDMRKNLINMTAHELRTPLTAIQGYAQVLTRVREPEKIVEYAGRVERESKHLGELIQGLIDSDPARTNTITLRMASFDLRQLVGDQVDRISSVYENGRDRIELIMPSGPVVGTWDRLRLGQCIANLIDNAMKYSDERIKVELQGTKDHACLRIIDHGIGMTQYEKEQMFKPYYRSYRSQFHQAQGMGLGLFITQQIVRHHGGEIKVDSEIGQGTDVSLCLPYDSQDLPISKEIPLLEESVA